jgi:hypothetical protein
LRNSGSVAIFISYDVAPGVACQSNAGVSEIQLIPLEGETGIGATNTGEVYGIAKL